MNLAQVIKDEARRLGFDLAGITTPDPLDHFDVYQHWVESGLQAEMGYLASERALLCRADPRQILPECESILVLGVRYPASPTLPLESHQGRIASYAWGADYHDALPERLKSLVRLIEAHAGRPIPNRYYTDTGPLLERELAQRAGLGWIGKNTCLIHPQAGSYFFLAEILLGLPLPTDPPFTDDRCGSCKRCIEACPTACIRPDRTLDAGRCLSYLTIELKGAIPPELRPSLGEWAFGCDICQQVCPWNRFATAPGDPAFAPRPGQAVIDLIETLALSPQAFNQRYRGTPIQRSKRRGLLRNAAVVLGNSQPSSGQSVLQQATQDDEALIREHAHWALSNYTKEDER